MRILLKNKCLLMVYFLMGLSISAWGQNGNFYRNTNYAVEINGPEGWYAEVKDEIMPGMDMGTLVRFRKDPTQPGFMISLVLLPVRDSRDSLLNLIEDDLRDHKVIEEPQIISINNKEASYAVYDSIPPAGKVGVTGGDPTRRVIVYVIHNNLIFQIIASAPLNEFESYKEIFNQGIHSFNVK